MAKLEEYISVGQKRLRCGYTTGTCAAAAARGAAELLVFGRILSAVSIDTPAGISVTADLEDVSWGDGWAQCAVRKDGGDDYDVTDGALVYARVSWSDEPGIAIDGGVGVGRVTREGLDQPVGAAAINSTPRRMISEQVQDVLDEAALAAGAGMGEAEGVDAPATGAGAGAAEGAWGIAVVIFIPEGVELAAKTFNPRLGIEGGISVLGTGGIVKPMSEEALIASIQLEMRMRRAQGVRDLLVTPGNYGRDFAEGFMGLDLDQAVQCSNFIGATIDYAVELGFSSMLVIGHIGKMAKVAAGVMNTHSRVADARCETLAAHAACAGAPQTAIAAIMDAATTDAALDIMDGCGVRAAAMDSLVGRVGFQLAHRAGQALRIEAVVFSKVYGLLGKTQGADDLIARQQGESDAARCERADDAAGGISADRPRKGEKA